jgi:hypothetical protein
LVVGVRGFYDSTVVAAVELHTAGTIEWLGGDSVLAAYPGRGGGGRWRMRVRCGDGGDGRVRGLMTIAVADSVRDEGEFELPCSDTVGVLYGEHSRYVRLETVRGRQRYRYGGLFLVPIDSSRALVQEDVEVPGGVPMVVHGSVIAIEEVILADTVTCVAFLGDDGVVRDLRVLGVEEGNAALGAEILNALQAAGPLPASRAFGVPVEDWRILRIPVTRIE